MDSQKVNELNERHRHRDAQRKTAVAAQRAQHSEHTESLDYFLETFGQMADDIALNTANLTAGNAAATVDRTALTQSVDRIAKALQELQLYLSTSTRFLPDSVVKRNQHTIAELRASLDAVRVQLLPKKKFGFRAARAAAVTADVPATTAAVVDGTDCAATSAVCHIDWTVLKRHRAEIRLDDEQVNGKDISLSSLTNCLVQICGHPGSLQLSDVHDCLVLCGPVARSVFADNCQRSVLALGGCQQLRLHSSAQLQVYMHVTSRAIVEDCHDVAVAECTWTYPGADVDFAKAGLTAESNNWRDVADFNWLAADRPSPNWHALPEEQWERDWPRRVAAFRSAEVVVEEAAADEAI